VAKAKLKGKGRVCKMPGSQFKAEARKFITENARKILLVSVLFVAIVTVISELQYRLPGTDVAYSRMLDRLSVGEMPGLDLFYSSLRPSGALLALVFGLILPVLNVGFMSYCMKVGRGHGGDFKNLFDGFLFFGKIVLIFIVTNVFILLWSLLLIFPGIIAAYRYRQVYYILLDAPEKGVLQCIRESKRMMAGSKLNLFLLDLSFIGWFFADLLIIMVLPVPFLLPLIRIWLRPYQGFTYVSVYDHLVNTTSSTSL
jgi:hypothetical protein